MLASRGLSQPGASLTAPRSVRCRHGIQPRADAAFRRTDTDLSRAHAQVRILDIAKAAFDAPPFGAFSSRALAYLSTRTRRQTPRQSSAMSWPVGLNFYGTIIETRRKLEVESPAAFGSHLSPHLPKRELTVEFGWIVCADHNVATDRCSTKNLSAVKNGSCGQV